MRAISIDLASGNYSDNGVVVLARVGGEIRITPIDLPEAGLSGKPNAGLLARFLVELANEVGATAIGLDGPQGWKSASNGYEHSRVCEALLHTQGKTGLPGHCKPGNYLGFISFCVEVFDELDSLGWHRLRESGPLQEQVAIETFPTAAWRALGLSPLPGKSKARGSEVSKWTELLLGLDGIQLVAPLTHDQLQAAISGLGVLAYSEGRPTRYSIAGVPTAFDGRHCLEGFILNPKH